jgi:hypothetical protein
MIVGIIGFIAAVVDFLDAKGVLIWIGTMVTLAGLGLLARSSYEGTVKAE